MNGLYRLAPEPGPVAAAALLAPLRPPPDTVPFDPRALALLEALRGRLLADPRARTRPDLQALAFWLRPGTLARRADAFARTTPSGALAVPRGLALHLPPANVGVQFAYSWIAGLLAGNRNLVRLPGGEPEPAAALLLELLAPLLADPGRAALAGAFVTWPHDDAITAALSRAADVRLIWGGDATVRHIRSLPLPPHGVDLSFPDRTSWAALDAAVYRALDEPGRQGLAEALAADLFGFDQRACASPRLVIWRGDVPAARAAADDLYPRLAARAPALGFAPDPAARLDRLTGWHRAALDLPVVAVVAPDPALTVLRLAPNRLAAMAPDALAEAGAGVAGLLLEAVERSLAEIVPAVTRRIQTLGHFGIPAAELADFARALNGRGIDRLVPVGRALSFSTLWDGVDLVRGLTRLVVVETSENVW